MRITAFVTAALAAAPLAATACADVDIVLALDASGSIGNAEYEIQKAGYARALTDPEVLRAIRAAGQVDVAVLQWGDPEAPTRVIGWHPIKVPADAAVVAAQIAAMPRTTTGHTGIGHSLNLALDMLGEEGRCGLRKIVNLSGDGRESLGPRPTGHMPLAAVRGRAERDGVTVNALAITLDEPDLALWLEHNVIVGPDAFVMQIGGFDSFAEAIVKKLAREIAPPSVAGLTDAGGIPVAATH